MLTCKVCPAYEILLKLIIQINYFLSHSIRTPHCYLTSFSIIVKKKQFVFIKKNVVNDFLKLKARNLKALQMIFEYRFFRLSG